MYLLTEINEMTAQLQYITHKSKLCKMIGRLLLFIYMLGAATLVAMSQSRLAFNTEQRELGDVLWKVSAPATFTLKNTGDSPLTITDVRTDCGCVVVDYPHTPIAAGASASITVTYDAQLLGRFSKSVGIRTDADDKMHYLRINGTVVTEVVNVAKDFPFKVDDIYLSADEVEFDDVHRGDNPEKTIMVLNGSKQNYTPSLMHLPHYITASATPEVLRPGRVGKITLKLNSREVRDMGLTQSDVYVSRYSGDRINRNRQIGISVTLLPEFAMTETELLMAPVAVCDTILDLGVLAGKKKIKGQMSIHNEGRSPLHINALQVYNPGINVSIGKRNIMPGESVPLKVTLNANSKYFRGRRRILLITNDPTRPKIAIDVLVDTTPNT